MTNVPSPSPSFTRLVTRLSAASVTRGWEPFEAIDWDAPEMQPDPDDPRWVLPDWDPLGCSPWYRDLTDHRRSAIGLARIAALLRKGIELEGVLTQGLVAYAATLPDGHPGFRYAYHEIIEEARHSMMFHLFISRCGVMPATDPDALATYQRVAALGSELPALFFLSVLAGESAFDHVQRRALADGDQHPLLEAINRLHCLDEARHLSFARASLREIVPALGSKNLRRLRFDAPLVVRSAVEWMLELPPALLHHWEAPEAVAEDVARSSQAHQLRRESIADVVAVCDELGLIDERMEPVWARLR